MKRVLLTFLIPVFLLFTISCGHKYYVASPAEEEMAQHKIVAILPAEMIFTGPQPKEMTEDEIAKTEETESTSFQFSLFNAILRHANSSTYYTSVNLQDINTTLKILKDSNISIRDSWHKDDKELTKLLNVDAVVRLRIQKQRYMSDMASYGIGVARQVIYNSGVGMKMPLPPMINKTSDIYASCNVVSNNQTLWNNNYRAASDWNRPANEIIQNITDYFGRNFPYKYNRKRRSR